MHKRLKRSILLLSLIISIPIVAIVPEEEKPKKYIVIVNPTDVKMGLGELVLTLGGTSAAVIVGTPIIPAVAVGVGFAAIVSIFSSRKNNATTSGAVNNSTTSNSGKLVNPNTAVPINRAPDLKDEKEIKGFIEKNCAPIEKVGPIDDNDPNFYRKTAVFLDNGNMLDFANHCKTRKEACERAEQYVEIKIQERIQAAQAAQTAAQQRMGVYLFTQHFQEAKEQAMRAQGRFVDVPTNYQEALQARQAAANEEANIRRAEQIKIGKEAVAAANRAYEASQAASHAYEASRATHRTFARPSTQQSTAYQDVDRETLRAKEKEHIANYHQEAPAQTGKPRIAKSTVAVPPQSHERPGGCGGDVPAYEKPTGCGRPVELPPQDNTPIEPPKGTNVTKYPGTPVSEVTIHEKRNKNNNKPQAAAAKPTEATRERYAGPHYDNTHEWARGDQHKFQTKPAGQNHGSTSYEVTGDTGLAAGNVQKGHRVAVDRQHKDHLEVLNKKGEWLFAANFDGTRNHRKTEQAKKQGRGKGHKE